MLCSYSSRAGRGPCEPPQAPWPKALWGGPPDRALADAHAVLFQEFGVSPGFLPCVTTLWGAGGSATCPGVARIFIFERRMVPPVTQGGDYHERLTRQSDPL